MKKTKHKSWSRRRLALHHKASQARLSCPRAERGFTIVEVIIALTILAISLTGLLGMSVFTIGAAARNDEWTNARIIAASQLENITAQSFDTLQTTAGATPSQTSNLTYNGKVYKTWTWYVRQGSASAPLRIIVAVGNSTATSAFSASAVSLSTLKTFYL